MMRAMMLTVVGELPVQYSRPVPLRVAAVGAHGVGRRVEICAVNRVVVRGGGSRGGGGRHCRGSNGGEGEY